jgi:hypothetical protein
MTRCTFGWTRGEQFGGKLKKQYGGTGQGTLPTIENLFECNPAGQAKPGG